MQLEGQVVHLGHVESVSLKEIVVTCNAREIVDSVLLNLVYVIEVKVIETARIKSQTRRIFRSIGSPFNGHTPYMLQCVIANRRIKRGP